MPDSKEKLVKLLRSKPNSKESFREIKDWVEIDYKTDFEKDAYEIFKAGENKPDNMCIKLYKSVPHIVSYLRYDLKKILIRTRQLYIDDLLDLDSNGKLKLPDNCKKPIDYGFFEPLLICFVFTETLGNIKHFKKKNSKEEIDSTYCFIQSLKDLGEEYGKHSNELKKYFRNGIAHDLRPHSNFHINLNIENEYQPPCEYNGNGLKINIPHFIDSLVLSLENIISNFYGEDSKTYMEKYINYINYKKLQSII